MDMTELVRIGLAGLACGILTACAGTTPTESDGAA
jgi:hypothetical protein